jgi:hypothetical protein
MVEEMTRMKSTTINPKGLGFAFGLTATVFYIGCVITMAATPRDKAIIFFNSLVHGVDVTSILRTSMPISQMIFGVVTTFILAWFAGAMIAVFYNLWVREKNTR